MSRTLVRNAFQASLDAVDGRACTARALRARSRASDPYVIAVGKAAPAMLHGALDALGERMRGALMITKTGYEDADLAAHPGVRCVSSSHPVPDALSFAAGQTLIDFVAELPARAEVLVLLSGGASSLIEAPVEGMTPEDIARATDYLLANGWDIGAMNRLRKRWSRLKGGGLLALMAERRIDVLLISDVPGDDPAVIGSGPLWPEAGSEIEGLPDWLASVLPPPRPGGRPPPPHHLVARNKDARDAALRTARDAGVAAFDGGWELDGDVLDAACRIAGYLRAAPPGLHVWGGETTVCLPEKPGRGGRNQQLALALADAIAGEPSLHVLVAGTDGTDGPGDDAGALVDGGTVARGRLRGLDVAACLAGADAGRFLEASGDLVCTGPTGTNVMDLVIALKGHASIAAGPTDD